MTKFQNSQSLSKLEHLVFWHLFRTLMVGSVDDAPRKISGLCWHVEFTALIWRLGVVAKLLVGRHRSQSKTNNTNQLQAPSWSLWKLFLVKNMFLFKADCGCNSGPKTIEANWDGMITQRVVNSWGWKGRNLVFNLRDMLVWYIYYWHITES